jgi:hypothetical protein
MFEPANAGFEDAIQRALWAIRRREGNAVRKKLRVGLVFAVLLCLLLAAVALAAAFRWGVLDFVTRRTSGDIKVLPEATELVQDAQNIPQTGGHLKDADFSVRQAVYDGEQVYLVVAVKPKKDDILLVDDWTIPTDSVAALGTEFRGREGSVADYAKTKGKARILCAQIYDNMANNWSATAQTGTVESDGTLAILLSGAYEGGASELSLSLPCSLVPFVRDGAGEWTQNSDAEEFGMLNFTITRATGATEEKQSAASVDFPEAGVRVDAVTLTRTSMAIYYRIDYEVTDAARYEATGGVGFAFLDESGFPLPFGAAESGGMEALTGAEPGTVVGTRLKQQGSLNAMEVLPDSMTLSAYEALAESEGAFYGAREIKMK